MPFSLHGVHRINWLCPFPTLHSSVGRAIHPELHRGHTVGELARVMGWGDDIPRGGNPIAQIAKGVVPDIGEWLAQQVELFLDDYWGDDDFESSYNAKLGEWVGGETCEQVEKEFNMTQYFGHHFREDHYEVPPFFQRHRRKYDARTKELIVCS